MVGALVEPYTCTLLSVLRPLRHTLSLSLLLPLTAEKKGSRLHTHALEHRCVSAFLIHFACLLP